MLKSADTIYNMQEYGFILNVCEKVMYIVQSQRMLFVFVFNLAQEISIFHTISSTIPQSGTPSINRKCEQKRP